METKNKKVYVSDEITTDVIKRFIKGHNYLIGAEMNSGKNYWARNVLLPFALENNKRTLFLSHRTESLNQQKNYLEDYRIACEKKFMGGMFTLKSYQAFQNMIKKRDPMINSFDYIICDEAHYFVSDSSFNTKTELSFNFLNECYSAVKIFMTGTYDGLFYLPWKSELNVLKEANYYNNNVKDLYRFEKDETALSVIQNEIDNGKKVIVFHNSVDEAKNYEIGNNKLLYSGNREDSLEFKQIAENGKFDCDVLNTTKLMTEATEIKDEKIETTVINAISDIDTFVQSTARVRDKKVKVLYKRISPRSIAAKLNYLDKQLFYYEEFERLGEISFIEEYGLDVINKSMKAFYLDTVIDPESNQQYTRLRIHKTGLAYLQYQFDMYEFMRDFGFEAFFKKYFPNIEYIDLEQLKREEYIKLDIIDNYVGKKIFKDQQQELCNVICNKYGLRAKNGSTKVGMKTINSFFEENNIPYVIESKRVKKDGKLHTVWILNELN